ncbi:MAG: class I SAM-dependent methyltransferase [Beijerinckiaceae bacterium]
MAQNIYDDPGFFAGYSRLPRSVSGLDGAPEWPTLRAMLPPLAGLRVLDIGCGFGWFSRWAREHGAASVLGVDLSENMLARARAETTDPAISYERADLDAVEWPGAAFDLAYSSLVLHYIDDLPRLFQAIHAALGAGGKLVFSVEHPIFTAPSQPGWSVAADGSRIWPVNHYLDEGPRITNWLRDGVVKHHRTIETYFESLAASGFSIRRLVEWGPAKSALATRPDWAGERDRPPFLLIGCKRT